MWEHDSVAMVISMVAFWALVITLLYLGMRALLDSRSTERTARDALDARLGRGEIGEDEYLRLRGLIEQH